MGGIDDNFLVICHIDLILSIKLIHVTYHWKGNCIAFLMMCNVAIFQFSF